MADFTGFYLDGIHSSTYGIIRTSDGNYYPEGLIPEFDDYDIELVGGDGDVYSGRRYRKTSFTIPIAFDHLTEKQLRELRNWVGGDKLKEFRFDERPYKAYWVKISSRPELEYVCFMEQKQDGALGEQERIYKGEGALEFTAYSPFGYCIDESTKLIPEEGLVEANGKNWQVLGTYSPFTVLDDNVVEWAETSGLKNSLVGYNEFSVAEPKGENYEYTATLYNPGDFDTDFELLLSFNGEGLVAYKDTEVTISINQGLDIKYFTLKIGDFKDSWKILLNSKNHTLTVYADNNIKNLRYDWVKSANWLKIPQGQSTIKITCASDKITPVIKYAYKYY
jgi:phage-related protein